MLWVTARKEARRSYLSAMRAGMDPADERGVLSWHPFASGEKDQPLEVDRSVTENRLSRAQHGSGKADPGSDGLRQDGLRSSRNRYGGCLFACSGSWHRSRAEDDCDARSRAMEAEQSRSCEGSTEEPGHGELVGGRGCEESHQRPGICGGSWIAWTRLSRQKRLQMTAEERLGQTF